MVSYWVTTFTIGFRKRPGLKPDLGLTSIPPWAVAPTRPTADHTGRSWTVVSLDRAADAVVNDWVAELSSRAAESAVRVHRVADDAAAREALDADLAHAVVGWRLMMAGPADACLRLRAHAVQCGVADDEMTVATVDTANRDVVCAHCRTVTAAATDLEQVITCVGCERNLFVYYHVSRRLGAHLGFMVDAERAR